MKHCPNPDCPGIEKFSAVSEYEDTATVCGDCGTALAPGPAPERAGPEPDPDLVLVPVLKADQESDVVIVESLLAGAEIPFLIQGEGIQDLFGWGRISRVNPIVEPVEFFVAEDNLAAAREVLADFLAADHSDRG